MWATLIRGLGSRFDLQLAPSTYVELLCYLTATGKLNTKNNNHFLVAQIMRLSHPIPGKHFKLLKAADTGDQCPMEDTHKTQKEPDYNELGKYKCMVWFRFVSRTCLL
jgi:hypothetical protein